MMKKFLYIPVMYHGTLFVTMVLLDIMGSNALGFIFLLEMCGVIISPVFYAVLSMCNAILNGAKVHDLFNKGLACLFLIGLLRIVFYVLLVQNSFMFTVKSSLVAIGIFILWITLFSLTDKMLKKRPKRNRKYGK